MTKFKAGDKVRIVKASEPNYWYSEKIGEIFTLKDFYPEMHDFQWNIMERSRYWLNEHDIELVVPTPRTEIELQIEINKLQKQLDDLRNPKISVSLSKKRWKSVMDCLDHCGLLTIYKEIEDQLGDDK